MEGISKQPTAVHRLDGSLRLLIWFVLLYKAVQQLSQGGTLSPTDYFVQIALFALLSGAILLASFSSVTAALRRLAEQQPVLMAFLPVLLVLPYFVLSRREPEFDSSTILISAMLLFLPTASAILNTPQLRRSDISLGLVTAIIPTIVPLAQMRGLDHLWLRLGACLLPILLLVFSTQTQKQRLNFLLACATLSIWFSVMFGALPMYPLLPDQDIFYFEMAAIPLFLYILALAGWFDRLGLSFKPSWAGLKTVALNLILLAVIGVPVGVLSGALTFNLNLPDWLNALPQLLFVFAFVALPQEILFRGTLLSYLQEVLGWPLPLVIAVSALFFGFAHLVWALAAVDSTAMPDGSTLARGLMPALATALLATICGIFYARARLASNNIATSATLHAVARWLGRLAFSA